MKLQLKASFVICAITAVCAGGCAKHEMVKADQMIPPAAAPATSTSPAKAAAPAKAASQTTDQGLAQRAAKDAQAQQSAANSAAQTQAALSAALDKVFFDFDSATLSEQARAALAKNAAILKQKANAKVRIEGNCDELGSDDYNLALGERRANAAQKYLQNMGIAPARLSVISYGKEKPADAGHDEAARAKNRRDEFVISSN